MDPLPLEIRDPVRHSLNQYHERTTKKLLRTMHKSLSGEMTPQQAQAAAPGVKIALAVWDRTVPRPATNQTLNLNGPKFYGWKEPETSSPRPLPNGPSSSSSNASTSSSATVDSGRRFWQ